MYFTYIRCTIWIYFNVKRASFTNILFDINIYRIIKSFQMNPLKSGFRQINSNLFRERNSSTTASTSKSTTPATSERRAWGTSTCTPTCRRSTAPPSSQRPPTAPSSVTGAQVQRQARQGLRDDAAEVPDGEREAALPQRGQEGLPARGEDPAQAGKHNYPYFKSYNLILVYSTLKFR